MISCTPIFHSALYIVSGRDESIANATPFTAATAALYVTHPERKLSVREPSTAETELASKHPLLPFVFTFSTTGPISPKY